MSIRVWIDAGHGGKDPGAVANGLVEKEMNLTTALAVAKVLEEHGVIVGMTRRTDEYVDINTRCKLANSWKANYFISIHYNAGGGDGQEIIHSIYRGKGEALAKSIERFISAETQQNSRGCKTKSTGNVDYFGVIRDTQMDAIIVEAAFIDSNDRFIVDTKEEQTLMGTAIAEGVLKYLGIPYAPSELPKATPIKPTGTHQALNYKVVARSCTTMLEALELQRKLSNKGFNNFIQSIDIKGKTYYRVMTGTYSDRANAQAHQYKMKAFNFDSFLVIE